eukprot:1160545-Pelagomonas_calceolata.AAC.18
MSQHAAMLPGSMRIDADQTFLHACACSCARESWCGKKASAAPVKAEVKAEEDIRSSGRDRDERGRDRDAYRDRDEHSRDRDAHSCVTLDVFQPLHHEQKLPIWTAEGAGGRGEMKAGVQGAQDVTHGKVEHARDAVCSVSSAIDRWEIQALTLIQFCPETAIEAVIEAHSQAFALLRLPMAVLIGNKKACSVAQMLCGMCGA